MNETDFAALSAGAALNSLSADDRRALETALRQHPEWVAHLGDDADTVAWLGEISPPVVPPSALRADLLARVAMTPQDPPDAGDETDGGDEDFAADGPAPAMAPPDRAAQPVLGAIRRRWFALAASLVLIAGIGLGAVMVGQQLNRPAAVVALERIENAPDARSASVELTDGGQATAHWSAGLGQAVLVSDGLPKLSSDETFELWLVRDEGPIAAGTFSTSDGEATALLSGDFRDGDVIAVTVEPAGGSPTGTPSSDPIVAIATA